MNAATHESPNNAGFFAEIVKAFQRVIRLFMFNSVQNSANIDPDFSFHWCIFKLLGRSEWHYIPPDLNTVFQTKLWVYTLVKSRSGDRPNADISENDF